MACPLEHAESVGVGLFDARHANAVQLARVSGAQKRLRRQRGAIDLAVFAQDIGTERVDKLLAHRSPAKHVVSHFVKIDVGKALVNERLASRRFSRAHSADNEQFLHARTSSIMPPPKTVAPI